MSDALKEELESRTTTKIFYFSLFSVSAMTVLGSTAIAPSLPNLQLHFSDVAHSKFLSKLVLTLPAIFIVIFSPISGFLFYKFKRLKLIYPAIIIWSFSGIAGFFLDNIYYILISRIFFGIATAFIMTGSSTLIGDYYSGIKLERALSMQGFFSAFGGFVFLTLSGALSNINWRFPFLVYSLGFIILAIAFKNLFEPPFSAIHNKEKEVERFNFFTFLPIYIISFFSMSMFYIVPTQVPFLITNVLGKSGHFIGISLGVASLFIAFSSLLYVRLRAYCGMYFVYFLCFSIMGVGYMVISLFHNYIALVFSLVLIGATLGVLLVTNSSWLFRLSTKHTRAKAYGFLASSVFMGQFLSPFITEPFVEKFGLMAMFSIFSICILLVGFVFLIKSRFSLKG